MKLNPLATCVTILLGAPGLADAATITATTDAQLHTAFATTAVSGDTILVGPNVVTFNESGAKDFSPAGITITAQNPATPPSIVGFVLNNATKVTVTKLHLLALNACCTPAVLITPGTDITFDHNDVDGGGKPGFNAFSLGYCVRCNLTYNNIHDAQNGILLGAYDNAGTTTFNPGPVLADHNNIWHIYENGVYSNGANHVTLTSNAFHDFIDIGDGGHPDAIQFEKSQCRISGGSFSSNNCPDMTDNEIGFNVIAKGGMANLGMQGILIGSGWYSQNGAAVTWHHLRYNIHDNAVCMTDQFNSILIDGAQNLIDNHNFEVGTTAFPGKNTMSNSDTITFTNNKGDGSGIGATNNTNIVANSGTVSISSETTYRCPQMYAWLGQFEPPRGGGAKLRMKK